MNKERLSAERMAQISEGVTGSSMLALWDEAMRARESEAELKAELRALGTALSDWGRNLVICGKTASHLGEHES